MIHQILRSLACALQGPLRGIGWYPPLTDLEWRRAAWTTTEETNTKISQRAGAGLRLLASARATATRIGR